MKLGLIGLGKQGRRYLETKNGGDSIAAVLSRDGFALTVHENRRTLVHLPWGPFLEQCDAIIIATPAETHAELAIRCLEAGKPVLVEKPLATNWVDCARVIHTAEKNSLPLLVGHTHLFAESFHNRPEIRPSFITEAEFGGPCHGDPSVEWGSHLVAMALAVAEGKRVTQVGHRRESDLSYIGVEFDGGDLQGFGAHARMTVYRDWNSRWFAVWHSPDKETGARTRWHYDPDAPSEHTALWHQVEAFKRMCAGEADKRGSYQFARQVYSTLFGEMQ